MLSPILPRLRLRVLIVLSVCLLVPPQSRAQLPFDECSETETWLPLNDGLPGMVVAGTVWNDTLYVVHRDGDTQFSLLKWDGRSWTGLSKFTLQRMSSPSQSIPDVFALKAYNGKLYLTGGFTALNSVPATEGLAAWKEGRWEPVPGNRVANGSASVVPYDSAIGAMTVFGGELYISSAFASQNNAQRYGVMAWNGSAWREIGKPEESRMVHSFAEWRGALYAGGLFQYGQNQSGGVMKWDGTKWEPVGSIGHARMVFVYRDQLYAIRSDDTASLARWDGTAWQTVPGFFPGVQPALGRLLNLAVVVARDEVYTIVRQNVRGESRSVRYGVRWDGAVAHRLAAFNGDVALLTEYRNDLIAGGAFTSSCRMPASAVARLCALCGRISGRVVQTDGNDCDQDEGKKGAAGRMITISQDGALYGHAITDNDGYYATSVPNGEYRVELAPSLHWAQVCPPEPGGRAVRVAPAAHGDARFGIAPVPDVRDIRVSVVGGSGQVAALPWHSYPILITCTNAGTVALQGSTIRLRYNPEFLFDNSSPAPSRFIESGLEWDLDLAVGQSRTITVWCDIPSTVRPGDIICSAVEADDPADATPSDNHDSSCVTASALVETATMTVAPSGTGEVGLLAREDSVLTYTVRFQNNGSDVIARALVVDTLSIHLDPASLVLGASSHPFTLRIADIPGDIPGLVTTVLIWEFNTINLPPRAMDFERNQVYFKYSLRLRKSVAPYTHILNHAETRFDLGESGITNRVIVTTPGPLSVGPGPGEADGSLTVYPNPAHGVLSLRGDLLPGSAIELRNILGELLRSAHHTEGGDAMIDLEGLPSGPYIVTAVTRDGPMVRRVTIVR